MLYAVFQTDLRWIGFRKKFTRLLIKEEGKLNQKIHAKRDLDYNNEIIISNSKFESQNTSPSRLRAGLAGAEIFDCILWKKSAKFLH